MSRLQIVAFGKRIYQQTVDEHRDKLIADWKNWHDENKQMKEDWDNGNYSFIIDMYTTKFRPINRWLKLNLPDKYEIVKLKKARRKIVFGKDSHSATLFKLFWCNDES